jgi:hypothetical protein
MTKTPNDDIAEVLERVAALLEVQDANPYRVSAYRRAARMVAHARTPIAELAESGQGGKLEDLPDIGKSIAGAIREFVHTARLDLLERLEGQVSPEDLFTTVPGIGDELAKRIHAQLHIDTLEDLELAAHDGRLEEVRGIGRRRAKAIRDSLEATLSRSSRRRARRLRRQDREKEGKSLQGGPSAPPVAVILDVDDTYRRKAGAGQLKTIAPRRFNPEKKAWLPILHMEKEGWHFTALFSNTARAHELGKIRDWVVVYYERDGHENQNTVVTETRGRLKDHRVVRGREEACLDYYNKETSP